MICYSATHTRSGKQYIGISDRDLNMRRAEHESHSACGISNTMFHLALRKYGKENFEWKVLADGDENIIRILERVLVGELRTYHPNGFNSTHLYSDGAPSAEELNFFQAMDTNVRDMDMVYELPGILNEALENPWFSDKTKELIRPLIAHLGSGDYVSKP